MQAEVTCEVIGHITSQTRASPYRSLFLTAVENIALNLAKSLLASSFEKGSLTFNFWLTLSLVSRIAQTNINLSKYPT